MANSFADAVRRGRAGPGLTRRGALVAGTAGVGAVSLSACMSPPPPPPATGLFRHGVASGDPMTDRVIIWTRVSPIDSGAIDVAYSVARDEAFTDIVKRGADATSAARDFTIKWDITGLEPGQTYWYRFEARGEQSPVGRLRTLPDGPIERMTLAAVSCANHPAGWFNVYREVAQTPDLDLVVHLGDYLYEYGVGGYATEWGANNERVPDPAHEIVSLDDYRRRYAQYRADPDLQSAHAAAAWITIWDDHESTNNAYTDGAENHQPETEGEWDARKRAAVRAYFEWMPIREPEVGRVREGIWRSFELGSLGSLIMLETRLTARSPEVLWAQAPIAADADPADPANQAAMAAFLSDVVGDPTRTMMGAEQIAFVAERLAASAGEGKPWQILGNQVPMSQITSPNYVETLPGWLKFVIKRQFPEAWDTLLRTQFGIPQSLDQWDGYPAERERLYAAVADAKARMVVLTGDTHCFYTNILRRADGSLAGHEFGTSSVTSPSEFNLVTAPGVDFGALTEAANEGRVVLHDPYKRGFALATLRSSRLEMSYISVNTITSRRYNAEERYRFTLTPTEDGGAQLTDAKA